MRKLLRALGRKLGLRRCRVQRGHTIAVAGGYFSYTGTPPTLVELWTNPTYTYNDATEVVSEAPAEPVKDAPPRGEDNKS